MKRKYVLTFVGLLGVAAAAGFYLVSETAEWKAEATDPRTVTPLVSVAEAKKAGTAERSFTGNVASRVQSNLGFRVPGKIVQRMVDVGQQVRQGQVLMRIDETDLQLALTAKRNTVIAAQAVLIQVQPPIRFFLQIRMEQSSQRLETPDRSWQRARRLYNLQRQVLVKPLSGCLRLCGPT